MLLALVAVVVDKSAVELSLWNEVDHHIHD